MKISRNPLVGTWEKAESDQPVNQSAMANLVPCKRNSVLIVDDEQTIRRVFFMVLSSAIPGLSIDQAANGLKGLEAFKLGHHAVILMDISMPVMDGEVAFNEIQKFCDQQKWQMPGIVFCTGFNPSSNIRNVVAATPRHCMLQKPVRNQVLADAIQERLNMA